MTAGSWPLGWLDGLTQYLGRIVVAEWRFREALFIVMLQSDWADCTGRRGQAWAVGNNCMIGIGRTNAG
jgi:hypothetical protein